MNRRLLTRTMISAIILTGIFALTVNTASAKGFKQARMQERFAEQDKDNSGALSLEEFIAPASRRGRQHTPEVFTMIDSDGDKQITLAELKQARDGHRLRMQQNFKDADTNSDEKLSEEEFLSMQPPRRFRDPEARFDEMDKNSDGVLQLSELPERRQGRSENCEFRGPRMTREERFQQMDVNNDGTATRSEFMTARAKIRPERRARMFEQLDQNEDGFLQVDEMRRPKHHGKGMRGAGERCGMRKGDCKVDGKRFSQREELQDKAPAGYRLIGNSPNPFNSSTTISYEIPEASQVSLKVYNVNGQEVHTLVNELQTANRYDVKFGLSELTSGVYFYHLTAGDFSAVNRMLYIK